MQSCKFLSALVVLSALSAPLYSNAQALYTVSHLADNFTPTDINNAGQISGYLLDANREQQAALYSGGVLSNLGIFGGGGSYGNAINDAGVITGLTYTQSGSYHAFVYDHGNVLDLGSGTDAQGINANGDVVGRKSHFDGTFTSFVYSKGTLTELGNLGTGIDGMAYDINEKGEIVGASTINNPERHASYHPYLYSKGTLQDLGTIAGFEFNGAAAINNAGRIAGYGEAQVGMHAFVYEHGVFKDVGGFGGQFLDVGGINEHGAFVGTSWTPEDNIGFIYLDDVLVDLNTLIDPALGWHIDGAYGINDAGQIAATGCRDFVCSAVRLDLVNAVPEPVGALLLLPGLLAVAGVRRRQQRSAQPAPRSHALGTQHLAPSTHAPLSRRNPLCLFAPIL